MECAWIEPKLSGNLSPRLSLHESCTGASIVFVAGIGLKEEICESLNEHLNRDTRFRIDIGMCNLAHDGKDASK